MTDPISGSQPLNKLSLPWVERSALHNVAMHLAHEAQQPTPGKAEQAFAVNVGGILQYFRLKGLTYKDLGSFSTSHLSQPEKDFVRFLLQNPDAFRRLASLDQEPDVLSAQDLKIAASLAGDALTLSPEDLKYLKEPAPAKPAAQTNNPAPKQPPIQVQEITSLLTRLNPNGVYFEDLRKIQPEQANLTPQESKTLAFLQSPPIQKALYNLSLPHGGLLLPEVIRVLVSLIWNPAVYGAMPVVFLKSPVFDDDTLLTIEALEETEPLHLDEKIRKPHPRQRKKQLHADKLIEILNKINPEQGLATLSQLQAYQPANPEEAQALNTLRQGRVFRTLARLDGQSDSVSTEDIHLVMTQDVVLLYDNSLMLVLVP